MTDNGFCLRSSVFNADFGLLSSVLKLAIYQKQRLVSNRVGGDLENRETKSRYSKEFQLICNGRPFSALWENEKISYELNGWSFLKEQPEVLKELQDNHCRFYQTVSYDYYDCGRCNTCSGGKCGTPKKSYRCYDSDVLKENIVGG